MQRILSSVRRAIDEYNLIEDGDRIAVGVSGGKDSLVLLKALAMYRRFAPQHFELIALSIDMHGNSTDFSQISELCKELNVEYHIVNSDIYQIVFEERKESNPCSLCAKLRRGMLNTNAIAFGCNKLALGHTADDVIHTFMLSLLYEGRLSSFLPKLYMDRTGMTVIRPLILTEERDIKSVAKSLPVMASRCPVDKHTKREYMADLIKHIQQEIPFAKDRIFSAITHPERYNLFDKAYEKDPSWNNNNNTKKDQ
ncbi:MAG: tRNA 2-thiocytidine(32) synthetase TtcA [Clostridiales bacterium]|nr:tRNA 2-thiocytidine(32) synthetase TtcA [Clostridiales bacterium]